MHWIVNAEGRTFYQWLHQRYDAAWSIMYVVQSTERWTCTRTLIMPRGRVCDRMREREREKRNICYLFTLLLYPTALLMIYFYWILILWSRRVHCTVYTMECLRVAHFSHFFPFSFFIVHRLSNTTSSLTYFIYGSLVYTLVYRIRSTEMPMQ